MKPWMRGALIDMVGVAGAVCLTYGASLLHQAAGWLVAGLLGVALWIWGLR